MKRISTRALTICAVCLGFLLIFSLFLEDWLNPFSPERYLTDLPEDVYEWTEEQYLAFVRKNTKFIEPQGGHAYNATILVRGTASTVLQYPDRIGDDMYGYRFSRMQYELRAAILKHYGIEDKYAGKNYYYDYDSNWWLLP